MQCFSVLGFKIIAEPESALLSVLLTTVPFILQLSPELFVRIVYREILQSLISDSATKTSLSFS